MGKAVEDMGKAASEGNAGGKIPEERSDEGIFPPAARRLPPAHGKDRDEIRRVSNQSA